MFARDYLEDLILRLALGTSINNPPTKTYIALLLGNPGDSGQYTEISYSGYARQEIVFTEPTAGTGSHSIQNQEAITFPESRETAGRVTHIGIFGNYPNPNTGDMLLYGELDDAIDVTSGVSPVFQIGSVKYTLSGKMSSVYRQRVLNMLRGNTITGFTPYLGCASGDVESGGNEFSGNGYARAEITFTTPADLNGAMAISNQSAVVTPYATGQWGNWTHTVIYDAQTGGNAFYMSARTQSNVIYKGGACGYDAGDLVLTLN